jgi:hypothetical protein
MSEPIEMLPVAQIRQWLNDLVNKRVPGVRVGSFCKQVGISETSVWHYAYLERKVGMSAQRQALLSKYISQLENGQIRIYVPSPGLASVLEVVENPRPRVRYAVKLEDGQARLAFVDRPKPYRTLNPFADVKLGKRT